MTRVLVTPAPVDHAVESYGAEVSEAPAWAAHASPCQTAAVDQEHQLTTEDEMPRSNGTVDLSRVSEIMAPKLEKAINADGRDRSTLAQLSGMALKRFERVVTDPGKASVPEVIDIMKALDLKYEDVFPTEAEMSA